MTFNREHRYIVFKHRDAWMALSKDERETLKDLDAKVDKYRQSLGKPPLICAVVESDWPEYEPTWKAIEERIELDLMPDDECEALAKALRNLANEVESKNSSDARGET